MVSSPKKPSEIIAGNDNRCTPAIKKKVADKPIKSERAGSPASTALQHRSVGAGDGNRTHDTQLGKLMFYH
jgi:hypothetical protein